LRARPCGSIIIPVATPEPYSYRDDNCQPGSDWQNMPPNSPPIGAEEAGRPGAGEDGKVAEVSHAGTGGSSSLVYIGGQYIPLARGLIIDCQPQLVRVVLSGSDIGVSISDADVNRP